MRFWISVLVIFFLNVGVWSGSGRGAPSTRPKPHVVIVMVDDMGYGDPGCYNAQSKISTPNIDGLARDGMRFTDAHAPGPLCHLSRYGLMTGRYPFRTDCAAWRTRPVIDPNQMTIASLLRSQGYRTAMVGKWHLGFDEQLGYEQPMPGGPVDRGFESYFGIRASTDIPPYFYIRGDRAVAVPTNHISANQSDGWSNIQGAFWRAGGISPDMNLKDVLPRFTDEAVQVIQQHDQASAPLMLYVAFPAPHTPWLPSHEFIGRSKASMYGDFAMMVDAMIGRVLEALKQQGMSDNALLIFTSDNGPVWYESDKQRLDHDACGGWRGMKSDAWEAGHRMPFIVRWPGRVAAGSVTAQTICFTDLLATLAALVDVPLEDGQGPDSVSLLPVLLGTRADEAPVRESLVMQSGGGAMVVRIGNWKYIDRLGSGGFSKPSRVTPGPEDPAGQLYNLATDPAESNNVYLQHPEVVEQCKSVLMQVTN